MGYRKMKGYKQGLFTGLATVVTATLIAFTLYHMIVSEPTRIKQKEPDLPVLRTGSGVR